MDRGKWDGGYRSVSGRTEAGRWGGIEVKSVTNRRMNNQRGKGPRGRESGEQPIYAGNRHKPRSRMQICIGSIAGPGTERQKECKYNRKYNATTNSTTPVRSKDKKSPQPIGRNSRYRNTGIEGGWNNNSPKITCPKKKARCPAFFFEG